MKLCEHIIKLYQNEIAIGNEPLYVSTPSFVDPSATANMYITMKNKLQEYQMEGIEEFIYRDYHFPCERYYGCTLCRQYISGPMDDDQTDWFSHNELDVPNSKVVATACNVYVEDSAYGKFMIPTFK